MGWKLGPLLIVFFVLLVCGSSSDALSITLDQPSDNNWSYVSNVTFVCNATEDQNVFNISLYTNINGSFNRSGVKRVMELDRDSNTTLLCRFENTYVCEDGDEGQNTSTDFAASRFMTGVRVNDSDSLTYPTSDNMASSTGTIEFWFKIGYQPNITDYAWLFSTDGGYQQIYTNYDTLYFNYRDSSDHSEFASKNISNWKQDEWHYIAGIWDVYNLMGSGKALDLFADGSNNSVIYSGDFYVYEAGGDYMHIGSDASTASQSNSTFDELKISNKPASQQDINSSYMKGAGNHSFESSVWTIAGIHDGVYKWNCLAYNNQSSGNWSTANNTLYVDANPPVTNAVIFGPNSTDDIDPGVALNFTANVTDVINVSSVIFQWSDTPGNWVNYTMAYNNSTGFYGNVNVTLNMIDGKIYSYRTWSNDTSIHSAYSDTYNLTAGWDYTWSRSPSDFGTAYCYRALPACYVGTLVINNTGDDTLGFYMTDDWPKNIFYNVSNPVYVGPKNATYINVTAEPADDDSEHDIVINVTASHGSKTPSPTYRSIAITLNSYSGGPYFDNDDVAIIASSVVYQGRSYNISARLKNIGNETAENVWLNWTLPAGWSNTSGSLNKHIDNLNATSSGNNTAWSNITVYISSSGAASGVQNVSIAASSQSRNLTANASSVLYVSCSNTDGICGSGCSYVTDSDCSIPQSPGGSGTTMTLIAGASKEYKINLLAPSRLDINRGESKTFTIGISNMASGTKLKNVYLSLSGYVQTFLNSSPAYIDEIGYGETGYFDVNVKAPSYATYNEYYLNLTVSGRFFEGDKTTSNEKSAAILLVTHKFIGNETLSYFEMAVSALRKMADAGFETSLISGIINEINKSIEEGNYDNVKELSEKATSIMVSALMLNSQIQEAETSIESVKSQSFSFPQSEKMLSLAKSAFLRGDYQKAEERMSSTMLVFALESGNAGIWIFMGRYWWVVASLILLSGAGMIATRRRLARESLMKKLDLLEDEDRMVQEMIKDLQKEHFIGKKIGTESYQRNMKNYEEGMDTIRKKRTGVLLSLSKKLRPKDAVKRLDEEEKKLKDLIIDVQKRYFERGKIGKSHYDKTMSGLRWELLEVKRIKEALESGKHA